VKFIDHVTTYVDYMLDDINRKIPRTSSEEEKEARITERANNNVAISRH
jgi:hypothetical protein